MKTKLVYVLTSAPEKYYIEQALMSVYSTRHWSPDAYIVLIVDDMTNQLLVGQRAEILDYISERIVVPFEDDTLSMVYRSRWLKTSVRRLVQGDIMYIDCDTIIQRPLSGIDGFTCEVGAILDSHLFLKDYHPSMYQVVKKKNALIGVDIDAEDMYFNGGVIFARDTKASHQLFSLWHQYWMDSVKLGMLSDQPALAKANRDVGRIINRIPDVFNCIVYTQNNFIRDAIVLHISAYQKPSYLFTDKVLEYVEKNGLNNKWLIDSIMNPCATMLPFDSDVLHSNRKQRKLWVKEITRFSKGYGEMIDASFADFPMLSRIRNVVLWLFRIKWNGLAAKVWMQWKWLHVRYHKDAVKENVNMK